MTDSKKFHDAAKGFKLLYQKGGIKAREDVVRK